MTQMSHLRLLAGALLVITSLSAQTSVDPARVERLLKRAVVIDLHADTTGPIYDAAYDLGQRHNYGQVDIPRMREGHVTAIFFATNPRQNLNAPLEAMKVALENIDAVRREIARHPSDLVLATSAEEILAAKKQGRIAVLIGLEGGYIIDSSLAVLRSFYELGGRYLSITHVRSTPWADAAEDKPLHNGLTDFGRQVVEELNRLGMMVDVSHSSDKTFWDILGASKAPVIASHSSPRVFSSHVRNMSDDMMRALAKNGGVIHINYFNVYLDEDYRKRVEALNQSNPELFRNEPLTHGIERHQFYDKRLAKLGRVPLSRLLDVFEHAIKVAGVDHVGMGSDFDGAQDSFPEGMEDISKIPNLVRGLMERGYSDADIEKVLGGNTLRVMREVEKISQRMRAGSQAR